jgi:hypothetical protein
MQVFCCCFFYFFANLGRVTTTAYANYCGPFFYLTHPVNFTCGRKPEYSEKTHDFRQSVDFLLFSHEDWVQVALKKSSLRFEPATLEAISFPEPAILGKETNEIALEAEVSALTTSHDIA